MATELRQERARPAMRMLRAEDAEAVAEILRQAPQAVFWPEASVKEVLEWKGSLGLVIEAAGKVVGFLIGRQTTEEAEVLNLAVAPQDRRKGTGGRLLQAAVEEFRTRGANRVYLEVRESNARSEEHTSELQSLTNLVCRLLLEKKNKLGWNQLT